MNSISENNLFDEDENAISIYEFSNSGPEDSESLAKKLHQNSVNK